MHFENPSILIGLSALAAVVLVHLVGRRMRRVELPTAVLAEGVHRQSRMRRWFRRSAVLALRLAAVALLVIAVARPQGGRPPPGAKRPGPAGPRPERAAEPATPPPRATSPVRLLIVDAAEESAADPRTADLVAAAFAGAEADELQARRLAAADLAPVDLESADVVFWIGSAPPAAGPARERFAGLGRVVVVPDAEAARSSAVDEIADGATIDAEGYVSDLLSAFEAGTSGDLSAAVIRRRLRLDESGGRAVRFFDGRPAILEEAAAGGRNVRLAFGPAAVWGDLAARPEWVVLLHSLAEALASDGGHGRPPAPAAGPPASPAPAHEPAEPSRADLSGWFVGALAAVVAAETILAAAQSPPTTTSR